MDKLRAIELIKGARGVSEHDKSEAVELINLGADPDRVFSEIYRITLALGALASLRRDLDPFPKRAK
jgi:hypothetical protein